MIHTLENAWLHLRINPHASRWSLSSRQWKGLAVHDASTNLQYRQRYRTRQTLNRWQSPQISDSELIASPHGPLEQLQVLIDAKREEIQYTLTFALPQQHPFLLWQLAVENRSSQPIHIDRLEMLSTGFIYRSRPGPHGALSFSPELEKELKDGQKDHPSTQKGELAFFSNGWQSWSYSGAYSMFDRFQRTRLGAFTAPMRVNAGTPQPRRQGVFASDMFGVLGDRRHRTALLAGFLSQQNHFGSLECWIGGASPALRLWANGDGARLDPGQKITTDWACIHFLHLDNPDPLGLFLEAVARQHNISPELVNQPATVGWCSWYQFFQNITPQKIRANLQTAASLQPALPLNLIQIDDGFESQVGDWFSFAPEFPDGVAALAVEARAAGFTPGLWLAPFIVHPKSRLAADHPDWLLRGRLGRPANAGYLWEAFTTALDLTHPEAMAYACEVIRTAVHEWGFPYLKLDFLYAGALPGRRHDPTLTRAQVLRAALQALREAAGEQATLVGCGCPLGSAIGLVDGMRIGADVDARWEPAYKGIQAYFRHEPDMPSARNAIHNVLTRASLHQRWWTNDPDCLLLRPDTQLSLPEIQTLASVIALTGGAVMLSDHLPDLPPERLRIAQTLLPVIGKRPHVLDWFDQPTPTCLQLDLRGAAGAWHVLALFNWEEHKQNMDLNLADTYLDPQGDYYSREFWSGQAYRIANGRLTLEDIPAHGVALLAIRPYRPHLAQYLGSNLHISQGLEVTAWDSKPGGLVLRLERPGPDQGQIELGLLHPPAKARLDGKLIQWQECGERRYLFTLAMERIATLEINYKI